MQNNIVRCPHCYNFIIIEKLNCGIFRHAIYKNNGKQIDPHSSKEICDKLLKEKLIYGCAKPFEIIKKDEKFKIKICEYK